MMTSMLVDSLVTHNMPGILSRTRSSCHNFTCQVTKPSITLCIQTELISSRHPQHPLPARQCTLPVLQCKRYTIRLRRRPHNNLHKWCHWGRPSADCISLAASHLPPQVECNIRLQNITSPAPCGASSALTLHCCPAWAGPRTQPPQAASCDRTTPP